MSLFWLFFLERMPASDFSWSPHRQPLCHGIKRKLSVFAQSTESEMEEEVVLVDILSLIAPPEILLSFLLHNLKLLVAVESRSAPLFQDCLFIKVNVLLDCISLFCFDLKSLILNSLVHQKERHKCESFVFLVNRHWVSLR